MAKSMSCRERYLATLKFGETDRPFRLEAIGADENTMARWQREGLPPGPVDFMGEFGMDRVAPVLIGSYLHPGYWPEFTEEVLRDDGRRQVVRTTAGVIQERFTEGGMSIPHFLSFPVRARDDLAALMPRLNPAETGRVDVWGWVFNLAQAQDWPLVVYVSGCFGFHRHLLGFENLMIACIEDPELIHAMSAAWEALMLGVMARATSLGAVDTVAFWEDMCYKNGPMISPRMFDEFIRPYYRRVCDRALELGIASLQVDTDGDCSLLLPLFQQGGINYMLPFEVQAGMDIRKVREQYPNLVMLGGLDKRALAKGRDAIDAELTAKLGFMLERGGYFPSLDHVVPPDVPLENWRYYLSRVRSFSR